MSRGWIASLRTGRASRSRGGPAATVEHAAAREASRLWPQLFGMGKG
jgi:hypothetical protein